MPPDGPPPRSDESPAGQNGDSDRVRGTARERGLARAGEGLPVRAAPRAPKLNSPSAAASNREARRREAEQDRELIIQAQSGDQAAFRRLVERHQRRAFA